MRTRIAAGISNHIMGGHEQIFPHCNRTKNMLEFPAKIYNGIWYHQCDQHLKMVPTRTKHVVNVISQALGDTYYGKAPHLRNKAKETFRPLKND